MSKRLTVVLALTFWLVYLFHFNPAGSGSGRFTYLTMALAERGTVDVTPYHALEPVDIMPFKARYYINTNPGTSFLAAPAWAVFYAGYRFLPAHWPIRSLPFHIFLAHLVGYAATTALLSALTAIMIARFVYKRSAATWRAVFAALLYAFGTTSFFLSTRLNQNVVITFLSLAIFLLVFEPAVVGVADDRMRAILIGLAAGLGILVDLSIVPFLLAMAIPIFRVVHDGRGLSRTLVSALAPIACLMLYQWQAFRNPLLPAQWYLTDFLGPAPPNPLALLDHLILPSRGLFVYMPFTALSLWYLARRRSTEASNLSRQERMYIWTLFGVYLLYVSVVQSSVFSGYGPRYLLPVLPYLCIVLGLYLRRREETAAIVLVGVSFFVQLVGAQCGRDTRNMFFEISLWMIRGPWLPVVDWLHGNTFIAGRLLRTASHGAASPAGLLVMLGWCLLMLWSPCLLNWIRDKQRPDSPGSEYSGVR